MLPAILVHKAREPRIRGHPAIGRRIDSFLVDTGDFYIAGRVQFRVDCFELWDAHDKKRRRGELPRCIDCGAREISGFL
jgi:hypothetical protein